ncbi:MAG: hypothetical protein DME22_16740 [Verrucomicrobia bacterium]|nr:MAG: hypothetical protein DME22_16740 [Verrucomicrobiota bacterium]
MRIEVCVYRLTLLILSLAVVCAQGAELYVSTQGSDSNPGTSAQPFRTISHAYSLAAPGTTINVLPGMYSDYTSGWGLHLAKSGTASSPIVLRSQVKGGAIIDGQNALDRNKGIYLDGSYHIIDGFVITRAPGTGIFIEGSYNQILNNEIHHNGSLAEGQGVYSDQGTRNNSYQANYVHDNGIPGSNLDHGFYLCGVNETVINNVLVRNAACGLQIAGYITVSNMKVYNNVMAYNGTSGIILWQALNGVDIKNNMIYQNGTFGINSWDAHGSGVVIDHNLLFGNGSGDYNFINGGSDYSYTRGTTISVAPLFVNSSSAGFDSHLGAGSPAINSGLNLSSFFTTDKDGAARAASGGWDLGAYRYGNTDTIPPTVSLSAPANNATVSGSSVKVSANATDNVGVVGVQFKLDGANLGAEDTGAPYSVTWNTTTIANGTHSLSAVARDAAGNQTAATARSVVVNNPNTAPIISSIADQTINAGNSTAPLAFTVSDAETAASSLTLSGSSSDPVLVPQSNIVFAGSGSNRTVAAIPAGTQSGTATITITVSDGSATTSTSFLLTVNPTATPTYVYLPFEAESATLVAPMAVASDPNASQGQFILSSISDSGSVAFDVNIPVSGVYSIWSRVLSPDDSRDSLYVSVDGGSEDIYDTAEGTKTNAWQWTVVNGRGGTNFTTALAVNPRTFGLSAGLHRIVFRARESGTGLDQILLTNDPDYVPNVVFSITTPPVRISSIAFGAAGHVTLTWPTMPGKAYRVVYKTNLTDTAWETLGSDQTATNTITSQSDYVVGNRFYSVITRP